MQCVLRTLRKLRNFTATVFSLIFRQINDLLKNFTVNWFHENKISWQWISRFSTLCCAIWNFEQNFVKSNVHDLYQFHVIFFNWELTSRRFFYFHLLKVFTLNDIFFGKSRLPPSCFHSVRFPTKIDMPSNSSTSMTPSLSSSMLATKGKDSWAVFL